MRPAALVIAGVTTHFSVEATTGVAGEPGSEAFVLSDANAAFASTQLHTAPRLADAVNAAVLTGQYARMIGGEAGRRSPLA